MNDAPNSHLTLGPIGVIHTPFDAMPALMIASSRRS